MSKNEELKSLTKKYLKVCNLNTRELSEKSRGFFSKKLTKLNLDRRVLMSCYTYKGSLESSFDRLLETLREPEPYRSNREFCLQYLTFIRKSAELSNSKSGSKKSIEEKISSIDPMFLEFLRYRLSCLNAKKRLETHLVSLTIQDLETRYNEILNDIEEL